MKVIFCIKYFLPAHIAGTEIYVAALCHHLQKMDVDVLVLKPNYSNEEVSEYFHEGIRVVEYPESSEVTSDLKKGTSFPTGIKTFKEIIQDEQPDIVHFHEVSGSNGITIQHLREVKKMGIKLFTTLHLSGYVCKNNNFLYKGTEKCNGKISTTKCGTCLLHVKGLKYGTAEALVYLSGLLNLPENRNASLFNYGHYIKRHKEQLQEIFSISEKVFVLSNWFKNILLLNGLPQSKLNLIKQAYPGETLARMNQKSISAFPVIRLLYVGRITGIKGLHTLLEALAGLKNDNLFLDIYGSCDDKVYEEKCNRLSSGNGNIVWKGHIIPSDVVPTIAKYDALILPSVVEEMAPLIIQESFAANVPVIGSDGAGISEEIIHNVNGLLFKMNDSNSLKNLLKDVSGDPAILERLKRNVYSPRSFDDVARETLRSYNSVKSNQAVEI